MSEILSNSLRVLFDMQACQTPGSAHRGVGRYSSALVETVASIASPREIYTLTSDQLKYDYQAKHVNPANMLNMGKLPGWHSARSFAGGDQDKLDGILASTLCQNIKPDVIHVSHVFEGFGDRVAMFDPMRRTPEQVVSTTLYDLIPLLFQKEYFVNKEFRRWYYLRVAWLRQADLLLAISESSRQDAINLLGIEPWKIVTIHGAISDHFQPPVNKREVRDRLREKFSLREKIVLYTGGDDHRKNIKGAIRGFSKIETSLRTKSQLVIVCSMQDERKQMYLDYANKYGLASKDILITGFVDEQDLIDFYGVCDIFVFPSLYEGLGLPVLEAMACGAPVIGGDNSSIRELIVRKDALFDASSADAIAKSITLVLTDKGFADDLRLYGVKRSAEFNWKRTAELSLAAFDEAVLRKRHGAVQSAVNGCLPSKRLAILSPLPPCRSGIADYNAQFIPFLAKYFEIDLYVDDYAVTDEVLLSTFRIFDVKDFDRVATSYDLILYEFGNSEFHAHMLPLLEKYPGVVSLHDAYLSGLFGYMDFNLGDTGSYAKAMIDAHGPNARRHFAPMKACPDANGATMVELPCTKAVLDKALGVISHSPFNLNIARKYYPQGWQAPYRTIPQMVSLPQLAKQEKRRLMKKELGFSANDFVLTTFGHIAWTKWGDKLLDAFLKSTLSKNSKVHLVFAGQLAADDFGVKLKKAIKKSGLNKRIKVTGYLSDEDYIKYLQASDLAIQLRTMSRGGTPKGVLDCLAYGLPVIVNNDASYTDYPGDVVIKLSASPDISEVAKALDGLFTQRKKISGYSKHGRQYVAEHHNPAQCAATYAAALHEFYERNHSLQASTWVDNLAPFIGGTKSPSENAKQARGWFGAITQPSWRSRRLYIDVSYLATLDSETGVSRVVKEIVSSLYCSKHPGFEPVAVELIDGYLYEARDWLLSIEIMLPSEYSEQKSSPVEFKQGDALLMLDSSWARYSEFHYVFSLARTAKVPVITVIYDLLPLTLPQGNIVEGGAKWFEGWLHDAIESSDSLLCISRSVADECIDFINKHCPEKDNINVGFWHLGADFTNESITMKHLSDRVIKVKRSEYLLVVGTIEPRKSHDLILDAMELLWSQGIKLTLCIAGKEGWLVDHLMKRIRTHPELNKRLFFIEKPTDDDISSLYHNASGLIFLSKGEGFGLPLVEAAHYGTPIICSDIPVFHEIAGEYATYVELKSPQSVSQEIIKWLKLRDMDSLPNIKSMPTLSWEASARELERILQNDSWYFEKG